jgi:hypothetical protein
MYESEANDMKSVRDLRRMAELYRRRGLYGKADDLTALASSIELRVQRESGVVHLRVVAQSDTVERFRDQESS